MVSQHSAPRMSRVVRTSFQSFCAGVLPGGIKPVLHLDDGVGNDQLVLCTEGEEAEPVVVDFSPLHAGQ